MDKIVIIADDLTGAADTGVQFCPFFDNTVLVSYLRLPGVFETTSQPFSRATALYTNSRSLGADMARKRLGAVARRLSRSEPLWVYKKVDSCLRGNLGAETEALMDELDYELSFIVPAFPEMGRTTEEDVHRVHGIALDRTEISRDPVTPVTESRLSRVVQTQSRYPVGHVALHLLEGDQTRLQGEIEHQIRHGIRHIVFDTTCREHLDRIARLVFAVRRKILPVGSAGLAASLGGLLSPRPPLKEHAKGFLQRGNHLLVCGTNSEVAKQQIKALTAAYPYEEIALEPEILADHHRKAAFLNLVPMTRSKLFDNHVVIRIESPPNNRVAVREANRQQIAESIVKGLGRFVAAVLTGTQPGLMFVTGGDTADAVLTAVAAGGLRILGEVVTGVVYGILSGGPLDGMPVVTKAGAFGQKDTLVVLHEIWQKNVRGNRYE